jgi:hypothetical protein
MPVLPVNIARQKSWLRLATLNAIQPHISAATVLSARL